MMEQGSERNIITEVSSVKFLTAFLLCDHFGTLIAIPNNNNQRTYFV